MFITDQEKEDLMKKRREFNRFFRSISLASALLAGCISMPNKQEIKSKEPDYLGMSYKKAIEEVKTPEEAAKQAVENDVHILGISSLAGSHKTLVPQVINELIKHDREDIMVIVGGVIPAHDYNYL